TPYLLKELERCSNPTRHGLQPAVGGQPTGRSCRAGADADSPGEHIGPSASGERPSIHAIVAGQEVRRGPGTQMSEREVADLLAPLVGLLGGAFYRALKSGQAHGNELRLKSVKHLEDTFAAPYAETVLALVLALRHINRASWPCMTPPEQRRVVRSP